jgi:hypothetical protein
LTACIMVFSLARTPRIASLGKHGVGNDETFRTALTQPASTPSFFPFPCSGRRCEKSVYHCSHVTSQKILVLLFWESEKKKNEDCKWRVFGVWGGGGLLLLHHTVLSQRPDSDSPFPPHPEAQQGQEWWRSRPHVSVSYRRYQSRKQVAAWEVNRSSIGLRLSPPLYSDSIYDLAQRPENGE